MSGEWLDYHSQRDQALNVCADQAAQIRTLKTRIAELLDENVSLRRTTLPQENPRQDESHPTQSPVSVDPGHPGGHSWGTIDIQGAIDLLAEAEST